MNKRLALTGKYSLLSIVILCISSLHTIAQVNISPNKTARELAETLAGHGVTVSNATLNCSGNANGTFSVVSSNLGLDGGIILTTGVAKTGNNGVGADGSEASLSSEDNGYPDDRDLDVLVQQSTFNACALEFDFVPKGDSVKFDYVFGSEEYITATCGNYNDAFAFFISGPGITGRPNIALVPGTYIPVAINSINSGIPGRGHNISGCTSMGPGSPFTQYFVNNAGGSTVTYRGFTRVLEAISSVIPCETYHLKIVIGDAGNELYDSGVFLKGGSLQANTPEINAIGGDIRTTISDPFVVRGCMPGKFLITRPQTSSYPVTIKYNIGGSAINGVDYAAITDSAVIPANSTTAEVPVTALANVTGNGKTVTLYIKSPYNCNGVDIIDSSTLTIYDSVNIHALLTDTVICKYQQVPFRIDGSNMFTYSWSPVVGLNDANIKEPIATPLITTTYTVAAFWPGSGCADIKDTVHVNVLPVPDITVGGYQQRVCINSDKQLKVTATPFNPAFTYLWTGPNGFSSTSSDPLLPNVQFADSGQYQVSVIINNGCPNPSDTLFLSVIGRPPAPSVPSPYTFCQATVENHLYDLGENLVWYRDTTHRAPDNSLPIGVYSYALSQIVDGCEGPKTDVDVEIKRCCETNIFIPDAFTPNGDGRNDKFGLSPGDDHYLEEMRVYNRWGQLMFSGFNDNSAWDGTIGGIPAETGAYYYYLSVKCNIGKIIKKQGSVILIR